MYIAVDEVCALQPVIECGAIRPQGSQKYHK